MSTIDAIYLSKSSSEKIEGFQGFVYLETNKKKSDWHKYVFLPNYYSDNGIVFGITDSDTETKKKEKINESIKLYNPRFGYISAKVTCVDSNHIEHLSKNYSYHKEKHDMHKQKLVAESLSKVRCFNLASNFINSEKYFFSNGEFVIRQAGIYETEQVQKLLKKAQKENPGMFQDENYGKQKIAKHVEMGHFLVVVNSKGEFVGGQGITPRDLFIEAEPFTYISEEARGQGIFAIFHEMIAEAGKCIDANHIYARYNTSNEAADNVYRAYGYIRQPEIKTIGNREVYEIKFPLK